MKRTFNIIFCIFSICCLQAQSDPLQEKHDAAESVLFHHLVHEDVLECIKNKYPELCMRANENRELLNKNFGLSKKNAVRFLEIMKTTNLSEIYSEDWFSECSTLTKEEAYAFINNFEKISKKFGDEKILSFQYQDEPILEFLNGYTKTYTTKGHPKANNSDWSIQIPKSWKASEGKDEHIIQRFQNDFALGEAMVLLIVQDFPENFKKSENLQKLYLDENFEQYLKKELMVENAKVLTYKPMNIASCPGIFVIYDIVAERLGYNIKMRTYNFQFWDRSYLYTLQCTISIIDEATKDFTEAEEKFSTLFQFLGNSLKINKKELNVISLKGSEKEKKVVIQIGDSDFDFLLDTGASISLINKSIINSLIKKEVITENNFLGKENIKIADGKVVMVEIWNLPSIIIGSKKIYNINFAVVDDNSSISLLGMNILNKLNIWKIDLQNDKIYLND